MVVIKRLTGQKTGPTGDQRRTMCKICRFSILAGEETAWLTNPLGLSHLNCARAQGAYSNGEA
jgi:hypothetical protein